MEELLINIQGTSLLMTAVSYVAGNEVINHMGSEDKYAGVAAYSFGLFSAIAIATTLIRIWI